MAMKQFMEKKIAKSREKAEQVGYIEKMLKDQQIAAGHGQSERRVESLRWQREAEEEQEEYDQDFKLIQAAQQKAQKAQIAEMEDNIAKELEDRHAAAIRTEMNRRRVCAGSDELKALRRKLQAAEMNKLRKGQFKEKEVFAVEEKIYEKDIAGVMEAKRQIELAQEAVVAEGKHAQRIKTKDLQLKAIADRSIDREAEYQIFLKDKKQVADIVDSIAKEYQLVAEEKKRKVDEAKLIVIQSIFYRVGCIIAPSVASQGVTESNVHVYLGAIEAAEDSSSAERSCTTARAQWGEHGSWYWLPNPKRKVFIRSASTDTPTTW